MRKKKPTKRHSAPRLGTAKLVFVCDTAGTIGYWQHPINDSHTRTGGALTQRFAAQDREKVRDALASSQRTGHGSFVAALQGGEHGGTLVEIHVKHMRMGSRQLLLGFMQSASEKTSTDPELLENELRLRIISSIATDVMWDLNLATGESWHSEGAAVMFGYPEDRSLSVADWWLAHIHPDDRQRVEQSMQRYLEKGSELWEETYRMRRPDGEYAYVADRGLVIRDATGKPQRMSGAMVDITARVQAEEKLGLASQALEHIAEGILILDQDLSVISVNRAYTNITGFTQEQLFGKSPFSLQEAVLPAALRKEILRAVATGGHWRGELQDRRADGSLFPELASLSAVRDKRGRPLQYVAVITDMTQLHKYEDRMAFLASHDALTGLPNRFMLMRRLGQAVEHAASTDSPMALIYLDMDNFALINSSFGTAVGDEVLRKLAQRLEEAVAGWGEAFHLGSDGFGVLLPNVASKDDAVEMAQNVLAALEAPLAVVDQVLYLSASIGIALAPPEQDGQMVFRHAGHAMHAAMRRGAGSIECFSGAESDTGESLRLATGLRQAMEHGELFLHYQPYFDLNTGKISGAEALVRWQHPELGLVSPTRFIPVAEETGHIVRLGEWVLKSACLQMRAWQDAGLEDMHMAVNISARQLRQPDFFDRLVSILDETGLLPGNLVLELTESSMMENPERTRAVFGRLHDLGVGIAIDDFGTGYSSLNYLRQYRVDYLKVDRAFVNNLPHDEHQQAIMRAIIAMAKSLDIQVIAEGVETAAQWEYLKTLDCEQGQGFLFAHPQPAARVEELMRSGASFFRAE